MLGRERRRRKRERKREGGRERGGEGEMSWAGSGELRAESRRR